MKRSGLTAVLLTLLGAACFEEPDRNPPPFDVVSVVQLTSDFGQEASALALGEDDTFFVTGSYFDADNIRICRWEDLLATEYEAVCARYDNVFIQRRAIDGGVVWDARWSTPSSYVVATDIAVRAGRVAVVGSLHGDADFGTGLLEAETRDVFVVVLDGEGSVQWARVFASPDDDLASAVALDEELNVYVAGTRTVVIGGQFWEQPNGFVAMYSANGDLVWTHHYGDLWTDLASTLLVQSDGVLMGGAYTGNIDIGDEMLPKQNAGTEGAIVHVSTAGEATSSLVFGGSDDDTVDSLLATKAGGLAFLGTLSLDHDLPGNDPGVRFIGDKVVAKLDVAGTLEVVVPIEGSMTRGFAIDADDGITVIAQRVEQGTYETRNDGLVNGVFTHHDQSGQLVWKWNHDGIGRDVPRDILALPDGSLIIAGYFERDLVLHPRILKAATLRDGYLLRILP